MFLELMAVGGILGMECAWQLIILQLWVHGSPHILTHKVLHHYVSSPDLQVFKVVNYKAVLAHIIMPYVERYEYVI